jgi:hypothetical protein
LVPRRALDGADLAPDWLRALMMATGWPTLLVKLRDQRTVAAIGDVPWFGMGFRTFPEVLRNRASRRSPRPSAT